MRGLRNSFLTMMMLAGTSLLNASAIAAPPAISSGPAAISIPPVNGSVTVNLRQLGIISGSAPLIVESATVLINGRASAVLVASVARGQGPGAVCVTIRNADF